MKWFAVVIAIAVTGVVLFSTALGASKAPSAAADQGRRLAGPFCVGKRNLKNLEGNRSGVLVGKTTASRGILRAGVVRSVGVNQPCRPWENRKFGLALPKQAGTPGPAGERGPAGPAGPPGPAGANGNSGSVGATGATGAAGATGATGSAGPQGIPGPKGDKGEKGDRGPRGEGCDPKGDDNEKSKGGEHSDQQNCGRGPKGDKGDKGEIGPRGPAGPKGEIGPPGPKGDPGPPGPKGDPGKDGKDGLGNKVRTLCISEGNNVKWGGDDGELCDPGHDKIVKIVVVG